MANPNVLFLEALTLETNEITASLGPEGSRHRTRGLNEIIRDAKDRKQTTMEQTSHRNVAHYDGNIIT